MKRALLLTVACATLMLATVGATLLASSFAHAGSDSSSPRIQMLSGTFADTNLPVDGVTIVTLISIPFSVPITTVPSMSKLEATSLIDITPTNINGGYANCELDVDNASFFTGKTYWNYYNQGVESAALTSATIGIVPGSHTFAVKCLGYGIYGQGSYVIHSRGTSVIIAG